MARGWESKDIESQQELNLEYRQALRHPAAALADERELALKRESLLLTRTRVLHDLERASHPRHRAQLELALAHLEGQLSGLQVKRPLV